MAEQRDSGWVVAGEFALVTLIWGSTWLVIKTQLGVVPADWSVAYRFAAAAVLLAGFTAATGRWRRLPARGHGFAVVVGLANFSLNYNLVYAAEAQLTSGLVALVFALLVVPNAVLAAIFLKAPITRRFAAGAALGITGLALVFAPDLAAPAAGGTAHGVVLVIVAVLAASVGNVLQASPAGRGLPPLPLLTWGMAYGAACNTLYALATAGSPVWDPRPAYGVGLAVLALAGTVVAFAAYFDLIRRIGPGPAGYVNVAVPIIALILSTLFEGYRWKPLAATGAAVALAGLVVALAGRRVAAARRETPSSVG